MNSYITAYLAVAMAIGVLILPISCTTQDIEKMEKQVGHLEKMVEQLSRQLMLQQLYTEEQTRAGVSSGLKQTRQSTQGEPWLCCFLCCFFLLKKNCFRANPGFPAGTQYILWIFFLFLFYFFILRQLRLHE